MTLLFQSTAKWFQIPEIALFRAEKHLLLRRGCEAMPDLYRKIAPHLNPDLSLIN
jgi:hypothetical protein